jgi:hypothetical protein
MFGRWTPMIGNNIILPSSILDIEAVFPAKRRHPPTRIRKVHGVMTQEAKPQILKIIRFEKVQYFFCNTYSALENTTLNISVT